MNKVELMGRLTKNIELTKSNAGSEYARFTLAVQRKGSKDVTDFIDCVAFSNIAKALEKYTEKGNRLIVTGALQLNTFEDKDKVKRTTVSIIVDDFYFVDFKKNTSEQTTIEGM